MASHIIPWSANEAERLNPENGICFSPLYDRAYDKGYISINEKFEVLLSSELKKRDKEEFYSKYFAPLTGIKMVLPYKYKTVVHKSVAKARPRQGNYPVERFFLIN